MCGERLTSFRKSPAQQSSLHRLQNISKHPSVCQRNACTLPNVDPPLCSAHLSSFRLGELGGIQAHSWSCGLVHSSCKAMLDIGWHKHEWMGLRLSWLECVYYSDVTDSVWFWRMTCANSSDTHANINCLRTISPHATKMIHSPLKLIISVSCERSELSMRSSLVVASGPQPAQNLSFKMVHINTKWLLLV